MASEQLSDQEVQQHPILKSIILHLLPGFLLTLFFFLTIPLVKKLGFPAPFALVLAILLVLIPVELGILFYEGKKRNGKLSLQGIVLYQEKIPTWQYFAFVPTLLLWLGFIFTFFAPVDNFLIKNVFSWLPSGFIPTNWLLNLEQYSRTNLIVMAVLYFVANVLTGPVVEELYFRGYLLPRISRLKIWAPVLNVVLFSLYHLFSPWQQLSRIIGLIPMVYVVSKKRNIYIGIFTHCLVNLISTISLLGLLFKSI